MPEHSQACFDVQTRRCVCPIENKGARVRAAGPALLAMLLRLEWCVNVDHWGACPLCGACEGAVGDPVHSADCELAALLEPLR